MGCNSKWQWEYNTRVTTKSCDNGIRNEKLDTCSPEKDPRDLQKEGLSRKGSKQVIGQTGVGFCGYAKSE